MGSSYEATWLSRLLHSFPHLDLTFKTINSTFNPQSAHYREALLFWAAVPVLWLLLTLLIFLVYFCLRCCQKEPEKKGRGTCLPWTLAILALLTCAAVGVGFYGNEDAHKGVSQFAKAGYDADSTIHAMKLKIHDMQVTINNTIDRRLQELKQIWRRHQKLNKTLKQELRDLTDFALKNTSKILRSVNGINKKAENVDMSHAILNAREYGYWRWLGTILLLCWEVLLCLLLLFGIGRSSKCTLLMFCAFGIFTMVLSWVSAGLHLGVSVGLGDFCVNPDAYIERIGSQDIENGVFASIETVDYNNTDGITITTQIIDAGPTSKDIVRYYIKCNSEKNPFGNQLNTAMISVNKANSTVNKVVKIASDYIQPAEFSSLVVQVRKALDTTVANIQQLTALVECTNLHKDYADAIEGVCHLALPGAVFLLLSAAVVGLLLTAMVLMASCAWRNFGRRKGYLEVDEDDPFLPRPDNGSPSYYRYGSLPHSRPCSVHDDASFTRGHRTNPREHIPMARRSTPPPAGNGRMPVVFGRTEPSAPMDTVPPAISVVENGTPPPMDGYVCKPYHHTLPMSNHHHQYSTNEFYRPYTDRQPIDDHHSGNESLA